MSVGIQPLPAARITRRALLAGVSALALASPAVAKPPFMRGGSPLVTTTPFVSVGVANFSDTPLAAGDIVQFGHGFRQGDVTSGNILSITDDLGSAITYTAARRANWPLAPTNLCFADLWCRLPNAVPGKIAITTLTISGTTATCTTASAHGLATGKSVLIQPQDTDVVVGTSNSYYCGFVPVTVTGSSTFSYTVVGKVPTGASTVAMEMCYCRVFALKSIAGSWDDALPAGKSSANILADVLANFDNETLELLSLAVNSVTPVGSGTFSADFATASAAAGTDQLRTTATGPTLCDFTAIMTFEDTSGGARHSTLAARFYLSAILNPTTGAVEKIQSRRYIDQSLTNTAMNYYTFQSRMLHGAAIVRSKGLSSDTSIDGLMVAIAPSDINITTNVINIPDQALQGGERVQMTTTGTLPSPLVTGTDYAVIRVDANNIKLGTSFGEGNQFAGSVSIDLTTQGSGTHTITCWQQSPAGTRLGYLAPSALPDEWTGKTGAIAQLRYHCIHDVIYLQTAKLIPMIDFRIDFNNPVAERVNAAITYGYFKSAYVFGTPGVQQYAQDATGGGVYHDYGAFWPNTATRRAKNAFDLGYAQTHRASTFGLGSFQGITTRDKTTWRPPVANNGPDRVGGSYPGMGAPLPLNRWYTEGGISNLVGFVAPTSVKGSPGASGYSSSHRYHLADTLYFFEGREDAHDFMVNDAFHTMLQRDPTSAGYITPVAQTANVARKRHIIGGVSYYTVTPAGQPRSDAGYISVLTIAATIAADAAPERPVIRDYLDDTLMAMDNLINTQAPVWDPEWLNIGGWQPAVDKVSGPGVVSSINIGSIHNYFEGLIVWAFANACRMYPSAKFMAIAPFMCRWTDNIFRNVHNSAQLGYFVRSKKAYGNLTSPDASKSLVGLSEPMYMDAHSLDGYVYMPDGTMVGTYTGAFVSPDTPPLTGEVHLPTRETYNGQPPFSIDIFSDPPPEITPWQKLYVRQANGVNYKGWKYSTTDSDADIIPTYSVQSTGTTATTINGTAASVAIVTSVALTGFHGIGSMVIIQSGAGSEIAQADATSGSLNTTVNLTITRSFSAITPKLNHGAGATIIVPYLTNMWIDLQNRDTPFPPEGHASGLNGGVANLNMAGYRTLHMCGAAGWAILGIIPFTAYDIAWRWFSDPTNIQPLDGPNSYSLNNSNRDSVNPTLPG